MNKFIKDKMVLEYDIAKRLKELMQENGYTQQSLSDKTKQMNEYISRTTIGLWCIGQTIPSNKKLNTLCKIFNVSKEYLFDMTNYRTEQECTESFKIKEQKMEESLKFRKYIDYIKSIGVSVDYYSEPIEQPTVKDVVIGDKQSYSVTYSYKNMSVEYFDFENEELLQNIENAILNLIFSYQARNKGESKDGSGEQT